MVVCKIIDINPSLVNKELLEQIILSIKNDEWNVTYSAINTFGKILACDPNLAKEALEQIIPLLKDDSSSVQKYWAIKALAGIVACDPSLVNQTLLEQMIPLLRDKYWEVRDSVIDVLGEIMALVQITFKTKQKGE